MTSLTIPTKIPRKKYMMVAPTHYSIQYDLNPWMRDNIGKVDRALAARQWQNVYDTCSRLADVSLIEQPPEYCYDAVFANNAGFFIFDTFLPSRFRHTERASEERIFLNWARSQKYKIASYNAQSNPRYVVSFEGAADLLMKYTTLAPNHDWTTCRNVSCEFNPFGSVSEYFILGIGPYARTTVNMAEIIKSRIVEGDDVGFNMRVRAVELTDPLFFNLDMCMMTLESGITLAHRPAIRTEIKTPDFVYKMPPLGYMPRYLAGSMANATLPGWDTMMHGEIPDPYFIDVGAEDARALACNSINIGEYMIMPKISSALARKIESFGYHVIQHDVSEFIKSGGGVRSLALELFRHAPAGYPRSHAWFNYMGAPYEDHQEGQQIRPWIPPKDDDVGQDDVV